jgi:hypothetical protein
MNGLLAAARQLQKPRLTRDVDLTLLTGFGGEEPYIDALLDAFPARIGDARRFAPQHRVVLLRSADGVGMDISLGALPFEEKVVARATPFSFGPGLPIRTCSAEDLIVLKLFASRPLDIQDAESVAIRQGHELDWSYIDDQLRPLAEIKDDPSIMKTLLRIQSSYRL